MFFAEDLHNWNELFPNCKIRESDISNPTEVFLTKTLISYLEMFGYKVVPQYNTDNSLEKRLFLIKLTRHIDNILKITNKSYTFNYYDLLRPTPKKTAHLLGILLNYLYYYNMYKTEVFTMANERITKRHEMLSIIKKIQDENIDRLESIEKIKENVEELSTLVPCAKSDLDVLKTEKTRTSEKLQRLQELLTELSGKLEDLKMENRSLKNRFVPDCEARELQTQISKLKENIKESKLLECSTENVLKERNESINSLDNLFKIIESTTKILPKNLLEDLKEVAKALKIIKSRNSTVSIKKEDITNLTEKREQALKVIEEMVHGKRAQFEHEALEKFESLKIGQKLCKSSDAELLKLRGEMQSVLSLLEEQHCIQHYLEENVAELLSPYI